MLASLKDIWDDDYSAEFTQTHPVLAHYTTLATLEAIVRSDQPWMSIPKQMNDHEELRYGMGLGLNCYHKHNDLILAEFGGGTVPRHGYHGRARLHGGRCLA